jgi:hypothetical protein
MVVAEFIGLITRRVGHKRGSINQEPRGKEKALFDSSTPLLDVDAVSNQL